ncbi:sensor histidine kinase [Propionispora hippei]|uniref:Histidine kinase-, DNA gyrase B-, and HSP90-like ATPase n=1 Tax=Propionispora hippei DSM 15287 TaxID=1123003 RepID=A0A1M6JGP6_9FIRM|nr:PocR ligand-binding domain-containing protein [Propionispora hippei]SHJ45772.1 Histidine kinase-, DNA gyrase B-, and HSP90-like ATPase [Propionispora hippei DSM 15287]
MENALHVSIETVINVKEFNALQNELSKMVDFSVVTVDANGVPIGSLSNFTTFCQLIRSSPLGRQGCIDCDRIASLKALRVGKPLLYECHCGLKDCTAPIVVDGVYIGSVLGGQVFVREEDRSKVKLAQLAKKFNLPLADLQRTVQEIKLVSEDYLHRCLRFYAFLSNYLAESGIKKLIQEKLTRETRERLQLQKIAKEQELRRIQAQMNPHFLFNALNSIARLAILETAPQTEALIYDLSNYLRYSIKNNETTPKLSVELDSLQHYLSIQQTRFGDRMSFVVDIDPELLDWRIPSMTLQPIVENAIIHGLEDLKDGGTVKIYGTKIAGGNEMLLSVYDNGVGFPPDLIDLFNRKKEMMPSRLGLGLRNTDDRIRRLYGENYGLTIESQPMGFTCVSIRLPKQ